MIRMASLDFNNAMNGPWEGRIAKKFLRWSVDTLVENVANVGVGLTTPAAVMFSAGCSTESKILLDHLQEARGTSHNVSSEIA